MTEFRSELIRENRELLDCVTDRRDLRTRNRDVVVVYAVERERIVTRPVPSD